jgi:hypothetical protein
MRDTGLQFEKRPELGIEFDASSLISEGRYLIVSATKDTFLAGLGIGNYTDQHGVPGWSFEWQKRLDGGFDVLTQIEPLKGAIAISGAQINTSDGDARTNQNPKNEVTGNPPLKISKACSSFFSEGVFTCHSSYLNLSSS